MKNFLNIFNNTTPKYQNFPPYNFEKIDNFISRSAQPTKKNIDWLKDNNVTDIINFRRDNENFPVDFNEKTYVESKNIKYHSIPSYTNYPTKENIGRFLDILDNVKKEGGKVHIHCREGADRTGMYAYIYERLTNKISENKALQNFLQGGWHHLDHPHLANFAEDFCKYFKNKM